MQGWCAALKVCLELFQEFFLFLFKYVFICAFFFFACMVYFEAKGVNKLVKVLVCVCVLALSCSPLCGDFSA